MDKHTRDQRARKDRQQEAADLLFAYSHPGHIFEHEGWDVRWKGWISPANMIIEFGTWVATRDSDPGYFYVNTLGRSGFLTNPLGVMDIEPSGPSKWFYYTDTERMTTATGVGLVLLRMLDEENARQARKGGDGGK